MTTDNLPHYLPELTATIEQFSRIVEALKEMGFRPQEGTGELRNYIGQQSLQILHDLTQQRVGYEKGYHDCLLDTMKQVAKEMP